MGGDDNAREGTAYQLRLAGLCLQDVRHHRNGAQHHLEEAAQHHRRPEAHGGEHSVATTAMVRNDKGVHGGALAEREVAIPQAAGTLPTGEWRHETIATDISGGV